MQRFGLVALALAGCLYNPTVEVDREAIEVPRGTSDDVLVSIDGEPVIDLSGVYWWVEDPELVTITPSYDGRHLRIGGDVEGDTVVHINSYGQDVAIPTHVGPPAIVLLWTEPSAVKTTIGHDVPVRAMALDTVAQIRDLSYESRWAIRDERVATVDAAGMMVRANDAGETALHVTHGARSAVVPVVVFK